MKKTFVSNEPKISIKYEGKGDLLMWKNLNVLHKRDAFDPNTRRVMHRTQIKGEMAITA